MDLFDSASKENDLKSSGFQQNLFTNDRTDDLNFSPENLPFGKLYHENFEAQRTAHAKNRSKLFEAHSTVIYLHTLTNKIYL